MALSNLDSTKLYTDLDALSPRSDTGDDTNADQVAESSGVYTTDAGAGGGEIRIDAPNKAIRFLAASGNNFEFAGSGITGQALYSFFKYVWKNVASITKFEFPMLSITNEQFEFINGWYLDDSVSITQTVRQTADVTITNQNQIDTTDTTVDFRKYEVGDAITITGSSNAGIAGTVTSSTKTQIVVSGTPFTNATESTQIDVDFPVTSSQLVRTAGWTVQDEAANYAKEYYAGNISLGTLVDVTDQPYYIQRNAVDAGTTNLTYTGPANEAVAIGAIANATSTTVAGSFGNSVGSTDADIQFTNATSTISSTTTDLSVFKDGDVITISNTSSNNGTFTITGTPTATSMVTVETLTDEGPGAAYIEADRATFFKLFVRERGKTYTDADLDDIGVTRQTYIVYRFPVSNADDLKITTTADTDIDADGAVPASETIYDKLQVSYLTGINGDYTIKGVVTAGALAVDEVYKDTAGRWFKVTAAGDIDAAGVADYTANTAASPATLAAFEGERYVAVNAGTATNEYYAFTTIIDANDTFTDTGGTDPYVNSGDTSQTVEAVYEFSQWGLRRTGRLNESQTITASDISIDGTANTFTSTAGDFGAFQVDDRITVSGASNGANNATFVITSVTSDGAGGSGDVITVADANNVLVTETAGSSITITSDVTARNGNIADLLVDFVGDTLVTRAGVFVQSITSDDQNSIQFTEATSDDYSGATTLTYPRVVSVKLNFNANLSGDADAIFYGYYTTGTGDFGTVNAAQFVQADGNFVGQTVNGAMTGAYDVPSTGTYTFQYDYDGDSTNGRTPGANVDITVIAIGLDTGQYVAATSTITDAGGTVSLVAPLERNFLDPV